MPVKEEKIDQYEADIKQLLNAGDNFTKDFVNNNEKLFEKTIHNLIKISKTKTSLTADNQNQFEQLIFKIADLCKLEYDRETDSAPTVEKKLKNMESSLKRELFHLDETLQKKKQEASKLNRRCVKLSEKEDELKNQLSRYSKDKISTKLKALFIEKDEEEIAFGKMKFIHLLKLNYFLSFCTSLV